MTFSDALALSQVVTAMLQLFFWVWLAREFCRQDGVTKFFDCVERIVLTVFLNRRDDE